MEIRISNEIMGYGSSPDCRNGNVARFSHEVLLVVYIKNANIIGICITPEVRCLTPGSPRTDLG